jgi:hypothetical protein
MTSKKLGRFALLAALALLAPLSAAADDGSAHRAALARPIPLGTSGGNEQDRSRSFCCGGTLGALVEDAPGNLYILSNNHVLARTNKGSAGEAIIQPGLIDQQCSADPGDRVASLTRLVPIRFDGTHNYVDAALAAIVSGAVDPAGPILDLGVPSSETREASVGLAVAKSGRTTGLTFGVVEAVNVTVDVAYGKSCGQGRQVGRFVEQIFVTPGSFSAGGDSGSLVVEDVGESGVSPRAVGLLFAGSDAGTLANPIDRVLAATCVAMAGASSFPDPSPCESGGGGGSTGGSGGGKGKPHGASLRGFEHAAAVQARHQELLLSRAGVVGVGIGADAGGGATLEVLVERPGLGREIPEVLEGVSVRIRETGPFEAR